jgi:hypothetical protein
LDNTGQVGIGTNDPQAAALTVKRSDNVSSEEPRVLSLIKHLNGFDPARDQFLSFYLYPADTGLQAYLRSTSVIYASRNPPENLKLAISNEAGAMTFNVGGYTSTASEVMRLVNPGGETSPDPRVGIGTVNPVRTLDVKGTAGSSGGVWAGSDQRWKKDIVTLENPLDKITRLRAVKFNWKREEFKENHFPAGRQIGLIAQEVEREFPELVSTDEQGYKSLAYEKLTAVLLEAIKAQQKEIQDLKIQIGELKRNSVP